MSLVLPGSEVIVGLAGRPPARPFRTAVPGPVWGRYPQAPEPEYPMPLRRRPIARPARVAAQALALGAGDTLPVDTVRAALARYGLNAATAVPALACVAQHYERSQKLRAHPNQYRVAAHLLNQQLVELPTGEGKTLCAALAAGVLALAGTPVHLLTANAYLASRDSNTHQAFFASLGLSCAFATDAMDEDERRAAWRHPVCYTSARTCAFDYLRDEAEAGAPAAFGEAPRHRLPGLCAAIVDEADCLLIDEALVPLVLAEPAGRPVVEVDAAQALRLAAELQPGRDFDCLPQERRVVLKTHAMPQLQSAHPELAHRWLHAGYRAEVIAAALVALHILRPQVHYIVRDETIVLIDETTGRLALGRLLPGLLQAMVCARESLPPPPDTRARSGLSYPRWFARYHHLCGLSGTLAEAAGECRRSYGLQVVRVGPHRPSRLRTLPRRVFASPQRMFNAAIRRAARMASRGRAVLIGTDSIEQARALAARFAAAGVRAHLLDAADPDSEAAQIALAGSHGRITISTQIAGRGTDIRLDAGVRRAGGLHVMNLQTNRSARIDRQMTGRAGRQGDPGSAEQWSLLAVGEAAGRTGTREAAWTRTLLACRPLAVAVVTLRQQLWQWQDRSQRAKRLRADLDNARHLHFSILSRH